MAKANKPNNQDLRGAMKSAKPAQPASIECADELNNNNFRKDKENNQDCDK